MPMLIPLPLTVPETGEVLCPALLADGAHLVLVDCGYPDSLPLIESAMANLGLSPAELTEVFITHHDDDHMGALARLCARYPRPWWWRGRERLPISPGRRSPSGCVRPRRCSRPCRRRPGPGGRPSAGGWPRWSLSQSIRR